MDNELSRNPAMTDTQRLLDALSIAQDALDQCITYAGMEDTLQKQVNDAHDVVTNALASTATGEIHDRK